MIKEGIGHQKCLCWLFSAEGWGIELKFASVIAPYYHISLFSLQLYGIVLNSRPTTIPYLIVTSIMLS